MSEEAVKNPEPKKKFPFKSILLVVAIMLVEGGAFTIWMTLAKPSHASGEGVAAVAEKPEATEVELKLVEFRAPNTKNGRNVQYELEVHVVCDPSNQAVIDEVRGAHSAAIRDALSTVIRRADPQHLQEDDWETIRRQFHAKLDEIFGENVVQKVLIPTRTPYPIGY